MILRDTTRSRSTWSRVATSLLLPFLLCSLLVMKPVAARGEDTALVSILKDTLYGAAAGLLLGGALTLVVDDDNRGDVVRWGIVLGTFAGFGYGIYETTRDSSGGFSNLQPGAVGGGTADLESGSLRPEFAAWADSAFGRRTGDTRRLVSSLRPITRGPGSAAGAAGASAPAGGHHANRQSS